MANTFKFGNGNWAVKDGYALAYNDENNNFKPLPFDFTRASSATTLNRQGLIETVPSGKPRIDFTDNTDGHLLLEPSRSNKITYSEGFNNWAAVFTSVSLNEVVSPDGSVNAAKLTDNSSSGTHRIQLSNTTSSSGSFCYSIFLKKGTLTTVALSVFSGASSADSKFDLDNGTIVSTTNGTAEIQEYGNDWYRCIVKGTLASTSTTTYIYLKEKASYSGSSQFLYAWGGQLEEGSYPTSYIPTEGSSVTRVVDDIHLTVPDVDSFNSSSGFSVVAKFDIGSSGIGTSAPFLSFNDDSSSTRIGFGSTSTNFRCRLDLSGAVYLNTQGNAPRTQRNSLFVSCNSSGWSQGANGSTNNTGTNNASIFDRLASITFITTEVYGIIKISELLVYNTRLSNTELQNLTS